ncbi:DUF2922 domain-containing protein [Filifactor villosus]|uniref:DUF2922 domain-containing protein n=1 Tax=Filifactor villosus TaxID=29374 RepID=A0ABV9QLM5_9FIRM
MVETLSIVFKKDDGKSFSLSVPYPKKPVVQEDIKALVQYVIAQNVFVFKDGSKVTGLKEVSLLTKSEEAVAVTMD